MKIAILGYGKIGKSIEKIAKARKHELVYFSNKKLDFNQVKKADVALEFSTPHSAYYNISECLKNNIPVVSGTTGWLEKYKSVKEIAVENKTKFLYASNFSIGVNIFFKINEILAKIMSKHQNYKVDITEIHHIEKLDAPSGTAISLAEEIMVHTNYKSWVCPLDSAKSTDIPIDAIRQEGVFGTHIVKYNSEIDTIQIKHQANSREGFALGAVLAAEWLNAKELSGCYTMKDVLNI